MMNKALKGSEEVKNQYQILNKKILPVKQLGKLVNKDDSPK